MTIDSRNRERILGRRQEHTFRSAVVNFVAALTVNAAIVLSVPRSSSIDPAPIVLQRKQRLIDGTWHEGEYVGGARPSIVVLDAVSKRSRSAVNSFFLEN